MSGSGKRSGKILTGRALRNAKWIEANCRVPEGRLVGRPVKLTGDQKVWLVEIYNSPTRTWICSMGRKNGKTSFAALLLLLHLAGPEYVPNSQLYSAAQSRAQAALIFDLACKIIRQSPDLSSCITIRDTAKQLLCPEIGTIYRALSAEAATAYGLSPVLVIHDELGQVRGPRSDLYEALETAGGAQERVLSIVISTQAPTDADLLSVLIDDAKTGKAPGVKLALYTADETLDPFSLEAIKAANPHFGDLMNMGEVRRQAEEARRMPAREAAYRNLVLNQRVNLSNPMISRSAWEACAAEPDMDSFDGPVYLGLDLSSRNDLTACAALAKSEDGYLDCIAQFWTPSIGLSDRARTDRAPYDLWADRGYIEATPGATVDYALVAQWLADYCSDHDVRAIMFDRWRIEQLRSELSKIGAELPLMPFGQGFRDMTPAVDATEAAILSGRLRHGGNPVMTMCSANAVVTRDPAGNRKLDKSRASGRIDGMVALLMALGGMSAAQADEPPKVYDLHFL